MRLWYLWHRQPAKALASLHNHAVSPEPSLFAHMRYGSKRRVQPKIRHLAPLDGCTCTFEEWVYGGRKVPWSFDYKNLLWLWGRDWKFRHEGNCSASLGLQTLLTMIVFKLEYVLFYQFYVKMYPFSTKKCSVRHLSSMSWRHAWGHLASPRVRWKYPEQMKITENVVGYARITHLCLASYFWDVGKQQRPRSDAA